MGHVGLFFKVFSSIDVTKGYVQRRSKEGNRKSTSNQINTDFQLFYNNHVIAAKYLPFQTTKEERNCSETETITLWFDDLNCR